MSCVFAAGLCAAGTGHDDKVMYNQEGQQDVPLDLALASLMLQKGA